jgi:hypothetical protein
LVIGKAVNLKKKGNEVGFRIAHAMRFRYLFPTTTLAKQLSSKPIISIEYIAEEYVIQTAITFFLPELECLFLKLAQFGSLHKKKKSIQCCLVFSESTTKYHKGKGKKKVFQKNLGVILDLRFTGGVAMAVNP